MTVSTHTTSYTVPRATEKLPPPYLGTQPQVPHTAWVGTNENKSLDIFTSAVTDWMVRNSFYDTAGYHWNNNGKLGDTSLTPVLCAIVGNRTIDGQGGLPPYPYNSGTPPTPWRADGVVLKGRGVRAFDLTLFQIPGTALVMQDGTGPQAGVFSAFEQLARADNITITQAIHGLRCQCLDAKLSKLWIGGIEQDGLTLDAPNITVTDSHIAGADVGCRVKQIAQLSGTNYHEASRIGTLVEPAAHGTTCQSLYIGPNTCWEVGLQIQCNGCEFRRVAGTVAGDAIGVDVAATTITNEVRAAFMVLSGGVGVRFGGTLQSISFRGWVRGGSKGVVVLPCTGCDVDIHAMDYWEGGTALDLSQSGLNSSNGKGNVFKVWTEHSANIIYPGGGTTYNLAAGNEVWLNGVKQ